MKKALLLLLVLLVPALTFAGTTGKIAGKVVDEATGDPLPGANVVVDGTQMGASTDINGRFVIMSVPPGIYSVRCTFIGYQTVIKKNIRVSVDLTTDVNYTLAPESIEGEEVIITAERPLIERNTTNETAIMTADQIENMPLRSLAGAVATNTGVVSAKGDMYVRGGRTNEVAYYVDGVYSNNLRTGERVGSVPITSLEQINYQAGGFSAEYGFANSGVVVASSKAGAKEFNLGVEVITDEFLSENDDFLNTYSYGYNVYNLTASGPLFSDKLSFFVSGEYNYEQDRNPTSSTHPVVDGEYTYDQITAPSSYLADSTDIAPEDYILPINNVGGPLPNNWLKQWAFNGNIQWNPNSDLRVKVGGNGTVNDFRSYSQFRSMLNGDNVAAQESYNYSVYGKLTHTLSSKTFYEATAYYSSYGNEVYDDDYERNMANYADFSDWNDDGVSNPYLLDDGLLRSSYYRLGSGIFAPPNYPYPVYTLNRSNVLGLKFDFTSQIADGHELKAGFEGRYNTLRRYDTQAYRLSGTFANNPGVDWTDAYRAAYTENFGYPLYFDNHTVDPSNTLDDGLDGAKHPLIGALYVQDKIELSDLVLNIGLRADYLNANDKKPVDPYDIQIKNGTMDEAFLEDTEAHLTISPRIGVSFPVTDRTVFHAQYGEFVQAPELRNLYVGWQYYAAQMTQGNQVDVGNPDLGPVRTTAYEVGIGQQLTMNSSLSITAYYKEITDNVVLKNRSGARPSVYAQYQNGDYGNVSGLSFTFKMRPTNGLAANVNYTLQYASGTGSTQNSNFYITWIGDDYYPVFVSPLDYDQRHTISLNLDYRRNTWGINVLAQAGSGFPYTPKRIADTVFQATNSTAYPTGGVNSIYTSWTHNIDLRLDKSFMVGGLDLNVYLWVTNLLDSKQPFNRKYDRGQAYGSGIYEATGRPDDNGWLSTEEGQNWANQYEGDNAAEMYRSYINFPNSWNAPRQVRLGLRVNL